MPINPDRITRIYIRQNTIGMTSVSPVRHIFQFSFPRILTNMEQQLYMIVDGAIVCRGVGFKALAAVVAPRCFSGCQYFGQYPDNGYIRWLPDNYGSFISDPSYPACIQKCSSGPGSCDLVFDVRICGTCCPYIDVQMFHWIYWRGCSVFIRACFMVWSHALCFSFLFLLHKEIASIIRLYGTY